VSKDLQNHQSFFKVKLPNQTRKERLMESEIISLYVICDEFLQYMNRPDHPDSEMSDAEVLTTALVAMLYCGGNYAQARRWLGVPHYIPRMLSKSQFSRRLNRLQPLLMALFGLLAEQFKALNSDQIYAIDTFPVAVCDNYRIKRCRIYTDESYRGKIVSKKRYFYGLKVHLMVTQSGQPIEFFFTPGSASDVAHLADFEFELPPGSTVYADKAYNHYFIEDRLAEDGQIILSPFRKKNSSRPVPPWIFFLQHHYRKIVETSASLVDRLLPKSIHATNQAGFELKIILFMLALSFDRLL
jgi:hypothetical protein